jgi:Fic family protein
MPGRYLSQTWRYDPTLDAPAKYRRACKYAAFLPAPLSNLPINLEGSVAGLISEAEEAIRALNAVAYPALAPLARLLLRTESIASSKIEGMQMGVRELARAEAKVETGGNASPTAREILANIDAMELAVNEAAAAEHFTVDEIVAIHERLMKRDLSAERIAGNIRTTQNWIGGNDYNPCGADFVPPPPDRVSPLLNDLCHAIDDELLPPLVQSALVHAQFETIHPFADGNGRTGRALIHVILRRRKLAPAYIPPVSVVLAANRNRYVEGLTLFRADHVSEWIERFAAASRASARLAAAYLVQVQALSQLWREKLGSRKPSPRADAAAWKVIDVLPAHPIISAPVAAAATGRSKPQIYEGLKQLEAAGVLAPLTESQRNRSWEAVGLMELIAGLESGQLPTPDHLERLSAKAE